MRHFTPSVALLFLSAFLLSGCKDTDVTPRNELSYNGTEYELNSGFLVDYGQFSVVEGYVYVLLLYSSGIKIHEKNGLVDSTSGAGHAIYCEIASDMPDALSSGKYVFDPYSSLRARTFTNSYALLNADFVKLGNKPYWITGGKVTVEKEGENYIIKYDCTEREGERITVYYKGPLKAYDAK